MLNGLDLFSGIGGISLGLSEWVKTVAYCEREPYCQAVLLSRMQDGHIDAAPIWDDVTTIKAEHLPEIDIIFGGFPCQDISVAGSGKGLEGKRSGLFFEIVRLAKEIKPTWLFLENVPAIRTRGLKEVISTFADLGYDCRWTCVSAKEVGAPHLRKRWFLLAHSSSQSKELGQSEKRNEDLQPLWNGSAQFVAGASGERLEGWEESKTAWETFREHGCEGSFRGVQGLPKPAICRDDDGIQFRSHRIKALGNAVVPLQARAAFMKLLNMKNYKKAVIGEY